MFSQISGSQQGKRLLLFLEYLLSPRHGPRGSKRKDRSRNATSDALPRERQLKRAVFCRRPWYIQCKICSCVLSTANALWRKDYPLLGNFTSDTEMYYYVTAKNMDLGGATEDTRKIINPWVEESIGKDSLFNYTKQAIYRYWSFPTKARRFQWLPLAKRSWHFTPGEIAFIRVAGRMEEGPKRWQSGCLFTKVNICHKMPHGKEPWRHEHGGSIYIRGRLLGDQWQKGPFPKRADPSGVRRRQWTRNRGLLQPWP